MAMMMMAMGDMGAAVSLGIIGMERHRHCAKCKMGKCKQQKMLALSVALLTFPPPFHLLPIFIFIGTTQNSLYFSRHITYQTLPHFSLLASSHKISTQHPTAV